MTAQSVQMKATGHRMRSSAPFHALARGGLVARGVIYMLVGYLAVKIAVGDGGQQADRKGALQTIAGTTGGMVVLWLLAVGFAGLAIWRFTEALLGQAGPDGDKAHKRLFSLGRGVFYVIVCGSTVAFNTGAGGPGSSDKKSKDLTARAMHDVPGGRWLVLLVGAGLIAAGLGIGAGALRRNFEKKLKTGEMSRRVRRVVEAIGMVGRSTRAVLFAAAGAFFVYAAVTFDPGKAKGVDGTLRQFADTSFGPVLLILVAAGVVTFGVYSWCEARWRRI